MSGAEPLQAGVAQKAGPKDGTGHAGKVFPAHSGRHARADQAARAGPGHDARPQAGFFEGFDDADVGQSPHRSAAESQADAPGVEWMNRRHDEAVYNGDAPRGTESQNVTDRLSRLIDLNARIKMARPRRPFWTGRNRWARLVDRLLRWIRRYLWPVHALWFSVAALTFFLYGKLVAATARFQSSGRPSWPELPGPSVLAIWHGCAPSLLAAFAHRKPALPVSIMVASDPRGDFLALLCRMLGFRVVRGDSGKGAREALDQLAQDIEAGGCALLTPDGEGPAGRAKPGAVLLAAASGAPLIPLGGDSRPALGQPRKWDAPRYPLPFGRASVHTGEPVPCPPLRTAGALRRTTTELRLALHEAARAARRSLQTRST